MSRRKVLGKQDISGLANYIASQKSKHVVVVLGAGVSTSAGIPDFRSPQTGRLNLPYPEAVFDLDFFRKDPIPFYALAHELYPGRFKPTIAHCFLKLLVQHSLLHTCFTQNIDSLERSAGVPEEILVEAHGSFSDQQCSLGYDAIKMKHKVFAKDPPKCEACGGLVKPDIVFFGEPIPRRFVEAKHHINEADLLMIMGTSMTVHPFADLAESVGPRCPRVPILSRHLG
ncbi:DHS-like NAD/FAD-binding domain-containing protein [Mycena olivaceomarginata]|nr:DHS-like NAD/FAD-binding domain-containing protein [Mycena olivaceomarginata]